MAIEVFNRREIKYMISQDQFELLTAEAAKHMNADKFNSDGRTYQICNLYLDTESDELIRRSLEKPVYKEKLRIRSYGQADSQTPVFFEIKKKHKGLVNKRRTAFLLPELYQYLETGKEPSYEKTNWQVFREIDYMLQRYKAFPKVFLSYDRYAFFSKEDSDFRMTLDRNIQTRRSNLSLETPAYGRQLLPEGIWLLEAKAFKAFPLWFVNFLSENEIRQVSFSKYGTEYTQFIKSSFQAKTEETAENGSALLYSA
ncbi:MAG: polyphosphate polymerase domain-containing protein [Treponemataceae bacterium]|nr:polyphosphate polymerase domain-containing protein [Treponemataceae bacterium]